MADGRLDEIGRLARSLNTMSEEISARESALSERSAKLALLNQQLEQELEERKRAEREIARQRDRAASERETERLGFLVGRSFPRTQQPAFRGGRTVDHAGGRGDRYSA
ncbi:MAG: hypothetical protein IPL51_06195 [Candidatus Competibacteraceae bacterium]|nr:hypothetical protein [Candidatus Competibacteraceae bacterium]